MLRIAIFIPLIVNHVPPLRLYAIQVLGHAKTVLIISFGFVVQNVIPSTKNAFGTIIAGIAVLAAAVSQIWTQELQKNHGLSSTQLLHNASPLMAVLLFACGIPLDRALTGSTFLDYRYDQRLITSLVLSNLTAIAVNLATFLVIGKCSPVTFQARVKGTHVAHCDLHPSNS